MLKLLTVSEDSHTGSTLLVRWRARLLQLHSRVQRSCLGLSKTLIRLDSRCARALREVRTARRHGEVEHVQSSRGARIAEPADGCIRHLIAIVGQSARLRTQHLRQEHAHPHADAYGCLAPAQS